MRGVKPWQNMRVSQQGWRFALCSPEQESFLHLLKGRSKKEEPMSTIHFPAVGHVYEAHFGSWVHQLHFESETVMTRTTAEGPITGTAETVQIAFTPIRPGVFLACWQEATNTTLGHVEVFATSIYHTNITKPNGAFIRRSGTLKKLR